MDHIFNIVYDGAFLQIKDILISHNLCSADFGLQTPHVSPGEIVDTYNIIEEECIFQDIFQKANADQKHVNERVFRKV